MKTNRIYIVFFAVLFSFNLFSTEIIAQCGDFLGNRTFTHLNNCYSENWVLEFEDNFDGGQMDAQWLSNYPYTNMRGLAVYKLSNLKFVSQSSNTVNSATGVLQILSKAEPTPLTGWKYTNSGLEYESGYNFSSGLIHSKDDLFSYGKYEIRCRIPEGNGHWPAFWIFGKNTPTWQEIDFFEFNFENFPAQNDVIKMNSHYNPISQDDDPNKKSCSRSYSNGTDFSKGFYTYTCIYSPTEIKWYLEGNLIRTVYKYLNFQGVGISCSNLRINTPYIINAAFPPGVLSNLIISNRIALTNVDVASVYEIDYVRYWKNVQPNPCGQNATVTGSFTGNFGTNGNSQKVDYLTFNQNATLYGSSSVAASNKIVIQPNTVIKPTSGNYFHAMIDPNLCGQKLRTRDTTNNNDLEKSLEEKVIIEENIFTIYPNPNTGQFNIELKIDDVNALIEVYDLMGKQVFTQNTNETIKKIDISDQPKGIYLVRITVGIEVFNEKIIYQ
ncbi:MAG: hypothetical protein COB15_02275 [Flavobacteriales bacterium]|nr:MAG: hypothetical protein COB15_02275 [Flavobacteriales bacterium]